MDKREQKDSKAPPGKASGHRIPNKPRDCGPNVDTWPILDEPSRTATKPRAGESGKSAGR
jgi:hypothetical protein